MCFSIVFAFKSDHNDLPFRPPVKNMRTMKTCKHAMPTMSPLSIRLKLKILRSVLLTVLKFLFSRVRKYFCWRDSVDTWPEIRTMVSSTPLSCSGLAPDFCGRSARGSFSTWTPLVARGPGAQ